MDGKGTSLLAPDLGTDADQWKREILGGFATLMNFAKDRSAETTRLGTQMYRAHIHR